MFNKALIAASVVSVSLISGCASVPMATPTEDAKAKQFEAQEGKANIYIYRNETMGGAVKMPVLMDGVSVGDTVKYTYILKSVEPGAHTIVSKTENDATTTVNAEAGKNYYVWQEVKMGVWAARSNLHNVDESTGKKGVSECKLVK